MEIPNLIAAAGHASTHGWPDHAIHLSGMLYPHLRVRGFLKYAEVLHTHAPHAAQRTADTVGLQRALVGIADVHKLTGRTDTAAEQFVQAIDIAHRTGDHFGEHHAQRGLGHVLYRQGRHAEAHDRYARAHVIARDTGDRFGEMEALCGLGDVDRVRRRNEQAAAHYEQVLAIARDVGSDGYAVDALNGLGHTLRAGGRSDEALALHRQALDLVRQGDSPGTARTHHGLAQAARALGLLDEARRHFREAPAILTDLGLTVHEEMTVTEINAQGSDIDSHPRP